jgi:hypothetical protein
MLTCLNRWSCRDTGRVPSTSPVRKSEDEHCQSLGLGAESYERH